jgi:hypothetical protein
MSYGKNYFADVVIDTREKAEQSPSLDDQFWSSNDLFLSGRQSFQISICWLQLCDRRDVGWIHVRLSTVCGDAIEVETL